MAMDRQLAERLNNLTAQNDKLKLARNQYLIKEAERKTFEARLVRDAEGRSQTEKLINAQATDDWKDFHVDLAELEGAFEFEKLKYEILDKAYLAEHASFKIDSAVIKRHGVA